MASLVDTWLLNETTCPLLPIEKIHRILKHHPMGWQSTPTGNNWMLLGYGSLQEAQTTRCDELASRVDHRIQEWAEAYETVNNPVRRWYELQIHMMLELEWYLTQLEGSITQLPPPLFISRELSSETPLNK